MTHRYPRIVFCTTCKGRTNHLARTLPKNIADNMDYPNCKFVILDYGDDHTLKNYLKTIDHSDVITYRYHNEGPFRMSHAKNMAHRCGILERADILVNMDADNYGGPGFATWIAEQFYKHGSEHTLLWANAKSVTGRARQGLAGRIAVSRNVFLKLGGYDERYISWAPEDVDFKSRAKRLIESDGIRIPNEFLHVIPHGDGLRFREYAHAKPTPESEAKALQEIRDAENVIANFGQFGMGTVHRNYGKHHFTDLSAVPTRIFGIGMQKTATTSLADALTILGLDSAHWIGPEWAKRIWLGTRDGNRSLSVERHYALCDNPIPVLYKELDKIYPGSKFILTMRDEQKWLDSIRKHWDYLINPYRASWDDEPAKFSHKIHQIIYGIKHFDAEIFINRYRRHNHEVREYFHYRPDDLLIMDMGDHEKWRPLCKFLGFPLPGVPYPHSFASADHSHRHNSMDSAQL